MIRNLLLGTGAVLALALAPSVASAASLSISGKDASKPNPIEVAYSGTADAPSYVSILGAKGETTCAPTRDEYFRTHEFEGPGVIRSVDQFVPAGPFSGTLDLTGRTEIADGTYLLCAYLSQRDAPPSPETTVTASGSATYTVPTSDAGRVLTNNIFDRVGGVMVLTYGPRGFTVIPGSNGGGTETIAATMEVSVSAATKRRYKLPSRVIMKGSTSGAPSWKVRSTAAVSRKLKRAKSLSVTYTLRYTRPVTETVTRKVTLHKYGTTTNADVELVRLSSSGDTHRQPAQDGDIGSGGGGRG